MGVEECPVTDRPACFQGKRQCQQLWGQMIPRVASLEDSIWFLEHRAQRDGEGAECIGREGVATIWHACSFADLQGGVSNAAP